MADPRGRFVWYELMTTDPDAAVRFYGKIFAWGITPFEHDPSYRMWTVNKTPMGGVMRLPEEARRMGSPPHWLPYVGVSSVDATVRQATGLGGRTYVAPRDIPGSGRFAVLADPQGAVFALHHSATAMPVSDAEPQVGNVRWHELATTDWRAAWDFYRALFGWQKTRALDMGPAGTYHMFGYGGSAVGGMYNKGPEMPAPPHWLCYVKVASVDRTAATVAQLGGRVVMGPMDVPDGGRIAGWLDPQGAAFAAVTPPAPVKKKATKLKKRVRAKSARKSAKKRKPARKQGARRRR